MKSWLLSGVLGLVAVVTGCAGVQPFPNRVAPGETVAVAAGWKHYFSRNNLTATITPQGGAAIAIEPARIRASVNLYPDPLSSLVLSNTTAGNISPSSATYALLVNANFTGDDADWWQTAVFIDIPDIGVPAGLADITINNPEGESVTTTVRVVDPDPAYGGTADVFDAELAGPLGSDHLAALERVDHYVVSFSGAVLPYAVQLDLSYVDLSGYIVNPVGLSKNIAWRDNGGTFRVLLMPGNQLQGFQSIKDLKFYVAATAGNAATASLSVSPASVSAFDLDGNPVTGISASVALVRGAAGLN